MTADIALVYGLVVLALTLFTLERVRIDLTALLIMGILLATGVVTPEQGLSGFSNVATVTVAAMFVLSAGLRQTGGLTAVSAAFSRMGQRNPRLARAWMMLLTGTVSAFINNTAAVAIFIPVVLDAARKLEISPSKLLMPLSFASMLGGVSTLIGTSTNLLVSSIADDHGLEPFSMFEFSPLGVVSLAVGFVYLLAVATASRGGAGWRIWRPSSG